MLPAVPPELPLAGPLLIRRSAVVSRGAALPGSHPPRLAVRATRDRYPRRRV